VDGRGSFDGRLRLCGCTIRILLRRLRCWPRWSGGWGLWLLLCEFGRRLLVTILPADDVPDLNRDIIINRAGVRFLLSDAEPGQQLEDPVVWNLELPSQLVDANLTHI
jgi:hypothetical protein